MKGLPFLASIVVAGAAGGLAVYAFFEGNHVASAVNIAVFIINVGLAWFWSTQ